MKVKVTPYLTFDGNCEEAFRAYERILNGRITGIFPFSGTPGAEHVPPDKQHQIMHVHLEFDGGSLMGSDAPGMFEKPQGISVSLHLEDPAQGERVFRELSEGGDVVMPYGETFWAHRFGMCKDRFGIPWMVNVEKAA